jgi:hypothetical protein
MAGDAVPPGGVLKFTLHGLPATDGTGRTVAGVLTLLLIGSTLLLARRPKVTGKAARVADERVRLTNLREALFAELVTTERARRANGGAASAPSSEPSSERKQLVARLERVYRDLAALDEQRAG